MIVQRNISQWLLSVFAIILISLSIYEFRNQAIYSTQTLRSHEHASSTIGTSARMQSTAHAIKMANRTCVNEERVLITGISGMIGSHVVQALIDSGRCYKIFGLVRARSDLSSLSGILDQVDLLVGDILDSGRMIDIISLCRPAFVYHFAAQAINGISFSIPQSTFDVNVLGTLNLFEALQRANIKPRVLVAGSSTEYGNSAEIHGQSLSEDAHLDPVTPYGISKFATEKIARQYFISYKIPIVTARLFIHIGIGGTDSLALHQFCKQIALAEIGAGPSIVMHGNLETARDMTDTRDSAPILVQLLEKGVPGEAYNVGSGTSMKMSQLIEIAVRLANVPIILQEDAARMRSFDEKVLVADITKIVKLTGWKPSTDMHDTVKTILNYWREKTLQLYPRNIIETASFVPDCPLRNIDIFLPVSKASFPKLPFLFNSINIFMPCRNYIHIIVDRADAGSILAWIDVSLKAKIAIHIFDNPKSVGNVHAGYILQAWVMLWADTFVSKQNSEARFVMFLDTDVVFAMPVTCASLFDENGKIYQMSWNIAAQQHFKQPCVDMVGTDCNRSYMSSFPFLMPLFVFDSMRKHFKNMLNSSAISFDDSFNQWSKRSNYWHFSQFVVMGEYMRVYQPEYVRQVFCPSVGEVKKLLANSSMTQDTEDEKILCLKYVPNAANFGSGYGPNYLGGGGGWPYRRTNPGEFVNYTDKYGVSYIQNAERTILHGYCLRLYLQTGKRHELCTGISLDVIPKEVDIYNGIRNITLDDMKHVFTPDLPGSSCPKHRTKSSNPMRKRIA